MQTAYSKFINQVHCPSFILLTGSVFIFSPHHWEMTEMLRSGWTQFGLLIMAAWYSICFLRKGKVEFSLIFHFFNRKKRPIFGGALSIIIEGVL